ncbi:uncharacterized protein LOC122662940 [Telopea speciosissima]|uniref:uncharacterized protein LOC122662940 n=1 Tax=Telopea speciosissima TaxID=54955 RepID=UPI001CC54B91|nr:uncharacterized protein LOC122662940 [Telopea speciosissima]
MSLDELQGTLTAYEMRMVKVKPTKKEAAFKAMKKLKIKQEKKGKTDDSDEDIHESKTKKGKEKVVPRKGNYRKRSLISKRSNTSSEETSEGENSDNEEYETLFMAFGSKSQNKTVEKSDEEEESEELKVERKKSKKFVKQFEEQDELISQVKLAIVETQKITDDINSSLSLKIEDCNKLEEQIVMLRIEIEKLKKNDDPTPTTPSVTILKRKDKEVSTQIIEIDHPPSNKGQSNILDEILSFQRSPQLKFGLGFEGSSSGSEKTKGKGTAGNPARFVSEKSKNSNLEKFTKKKVDRDGFTTICRMQKTGQAYKFHKQEQAHSKPSPWILDSGCSTHMTGDKDKFLNLEHVGKGLVRFGNNDGARVEGKGKIRLYNEHISSNNALYVSELKHNILSVSQLCDSGNEVLFTKDGCVIKKTKNGKIEAQGSRTACNLYALFEGLEEMCMISKKGVLLDDNFEVLKDKPEVITPQAQ